MRSKSDRKLKIDEYNAINACRKLSHTPIIHNFLKNPKIKYFDSALANDIFQKLISNKNMKVSLLPISPMGYIHDPNKRSKEIEEWLSDCCSGYGVSIDCDLFFELEEDKVAFIAKFYE